MITTPENDRPGFENDADSAAQDPLAEDDQASEMERVQEEAAEERKEGGYQ